MAVSSEECAGFVQPGAGIAVAVPGVVRLLRAFPAHIGHGCPQGSDEVRERAVRCRLRPILVKPTACAAKMAIHASAIVGVK